MNMSIRFPHLGIDLGYVGKTVSVFGFELTIYGILVMAGMLLGLTVVVLQAKRQNQDQNLYLEALIPGVVFGVICARACYIALNWKLFADEPTRALWDLRTGGLSFYGGFAGEVIALAVFCKIRKLSFGRMADTLSIGLVSSQMIGTWGNFFSREFIGTSTDSIFAMQIPVETVGSMELTSEMQKHLVKAGDVSWVQVHPLWFYESLWCLLLLVILLAYTKRKKFQGEIFMRYLAGYALGNAGIEWLRSGRPYIPGTHLPVLIPILLGIFVIFSIVATVRRILSKKREKFQKRRMEERYASEEKSSRGYQNMQSFEDVSDEFRGIFSETGESTSETEPDITEKSDELPKPISDSGQTEDEIK